MKTIMGIGLGWLGWLGGLAAEGIPFSDLAGQTDRQVVVDREKGQYLGHVTTCLLDDGKTILAVYPKGHGKGPVVYKRSTDGGRTWSERLPTPEIWATSKEVRLTEDGMKVAQLEMGRPFGSHMVLPMGREVPVWGVADAGSEVRVSFGGRSQTAKVGADGEWQVNLSPMEASSDGRQLTVESAGQRVVLEDVLVGELWLSSGQSNMDFSLSRAVGGKDEARGAKDFPGIRLMNLSGVGTGGRVFNRAERARLNAEGYFTGNWQVASEKSTGAFSAVAWWAGRMIHERKGVPVGLVDNSVGGSGAEAWLPREVLESREDYAELLGAQWMDSEKVGTWARGRARLNLGGDTEGNHPFRPGFLFDAGVRWWGAFPFDGVLWYQGETNAEIHDDAWNERLITDLVQGWRKAMEQPKLPFFMVQLPRIGGGDPLRKWWPQFRAVQARAAAKLDGVTLIETQDLGWDSPDVHPPDKRPVGERLGAAVIKSRNKP